MPPFAATPRTEAGQSPCLVLKFGSSVLRDEAACAAVVTEIGRQRLPRRPLLVVVSALAGRTDQLLAELPAAVRDHGAAEHLARGEFEAVQSLSRALTAAGVPHGSLTPRAAELRADGPPFEATPRSVDRVHLRRCLAAEGLLLFPGFVAGDAAGRTLLLGRGGSDLTAVFLAAELGAELRLLKDVDGLFERDPRGAPAPPRHLPRASYAQVAELAGELVQPRALELARVRGLTFEIAALGSARGTMVGPGP
jgi:homoserine dehydrogenase